MKDEWVAAALFDDAVVAELLSRLKQYYSQPEKPHISLSLPLGWGHRQPRSKPKKDLLAAAATTTTTTTTRCSPTTPLSWSGAASPSDGGCDCDSNSNSSRPSSDPFRSKGALTNDTSSISTNIRRSKMKKESASLHVSLLNEHNARINNHKRIKIDLNLQTSSSTEVGVPSHCNPMEASTSHHHHPHPLPLPPSAASPRHQVQQDGFGSSGSSRVEKEVDMQNKSCFLLPDLNMMPSEEGFGPQEIFNGFS